jgi:hypothetical protein
MKKTEVHDKVPAQGGTNAVAAVVGPGYAAHVCPTG